MLSAIAPGHGSQQRDRTGDEDDGMNETILPYDYKVISSSLHHRGASHIPPPSSSSSASEPFCDAFLTATFPTAAPPPPPPR